MSSRFESWFSDFVAQHNLPATGRSCGGQVTLEHKVAKPTSASHDHEKHDASIVQLKPRDTSMDRRPSMS